MAKRITNEQIVQMVTLYQKLGTYAAVARELGISTSTVSKYVKEAGSIKVYSDAPAAKPIEQIDVESVKTFSTLTDEEQTSLDEWYKEFGQ